MQLEFVEGVRLYRWIFAIALGASLGAVGVALASAMVARWRPRAAAVIAPHPALWLLGGAGLVSLAWAMLVTTESSPLHRVTFETKEFLSDLRFIVAYGVAFGAGLAIALVLAGASIRARLLRLSGPARLALGVAPAAALVVSVVGLVTVVEAVTDEVDVHAPGNHPQDARSVAPVGSVSIGSAAFATGLVVTPAGEVFFAENTTGRIGVLSPQPGGGYAESTFGTIELPEAGRLFHLEIHPEWPQQPYLYATAHHGEGEAQRLGVLLLEADGLAMRGAERVVSGLPTEDPRRGAGGDHYGSALAVCGEHLYLSVGDTDSNGPGSHRPGFVRGRAQLPGFAEGKVLRYRIAGGALEPAGVISADLPLYAMGLRNTFDMTCTSDGELIVADNGLTGHDQVRLVGAGSNHEWPLSHERNTLAPPVWDSGLTHMGPTGIAVRAGADGDEVFFASFHSNAVYRLSPSADRNAAAGIEILHQAQAPLLALTEGADGCLYVADVGEIHVLADGRCEAAARAALARSVGSFEGSAATIYGQSCASCHGPDRAGGGIGPPLTAATLTGDDEGYIATILGGRRGEYEMPAWALLGLTFDQARALLDYLRSE